MAENKKSGMSEALQGVVEAVVWLAFGVWAFAYSFNFAGPLLTFKLGAAFWPQMVTGGLIACACVLLVASVVAKIRESTLVAEKAPTALEKITDELPKDTTHVTKKTLAVFAVPLIYVYAIHKLGFLLITPLFLLGYMYLLGVRQWRTLIAVTAGVYVGIVLIFVKLIFTPLPQGVGYFHSLNGQLIGLIQ